MNPNEIQNIEPKRSPVVNPFKSANTSIFQNSQNLNNLNFNINPSLANIIEEKHEIIKDENGTKIIEEKKYEYNNVPFNSLIKEESQSNKINTSSNINPFGFSKGRISVNNSNKSFKIELFRSQNNSEQKNGSQRQNNLNQVQVINLNQNKKENYKELIKRIAMQLKLKIKPPTKGFFYNYIMQERQKKYKTLVKRIAIQLKKRIKLPTSKIFKIYESYRILIKRIAAALNKSIKRKNNQKEEKIIIDEVNVVSQSGSKKSKNKRNLKYDITVFTKEDNYRENMLKLSEDNGMNKNEDNQDLNMSQDLNISLSNIEVTKSNFVHDFKKFLDKVNIKIINNLPVTLDEKNKLYFQQNNFWLLIINYLFYQNKSLSLYDIISLLEQYFLWCKEINFENFNSIKEIIKEYIKDNFSEDAINQFLFMNQIKNIEYIFEKFERSIKHYLIDDHKEIKLENFSNQCDCELCKSDEACVKKVSDLNKDKVKIVKSENIDFIGKDIKNIEMDIGNVDEVFFKGLTEKKKTKFTESKTRISENSKIEYNNIYTRVDSDEKDKTFKNISKKKLSIKDVEEEEKEKVIKEEENNKENEEDSTKYKKKEKKTKKDKSRNKHKKKEKKKDDEDNEDEEEEEKPKRKKKLRKSNKSENSKDYDDNSEEIVKHKSRSKNKSRTKKNKNTEKNDDSDSDKKEKNDDEESLNNSNRKKSKTPKNKKSKKC